MGPDWWEGQVIFNLDLSVDAKNMAMQKAARHRGLFTEAEAEDVGPRVDELHGYGEDVGGVVANEDDDQYSNDKKGEQSYAFKLNTLVDILTRKAEVAAGSAGGQKRDLHRDMKSVHDVFGSELDSFPDAFSAAHNACLLYTSDAADE